MQKKKQDDNKTITGSVVAGVAIAGIEIAMALRNKKTREKVKKMLTNVKDQALDYVEALQAEPVKK